MSVVTISYHYFGCKKLTHYSGILITPIGTAVISQQNQTLKTASMADQFHTKISIFSQCIMECVLQRVAFVTWNQ